MVYLKFNLLTLYSYFILLVCALILLIVPSHKAWADQYKSQRSGGWKTSELWLRSTDAGQNFSPASTIPGSGPSDTVTIADEHTVVIDTSFIVAALNVGTGKSAKLNFDSSGVSRTLRIEHTLTVSPGAQFTSQTRGPVAIHKMTLGGDVVTDGIFNLSVNGRSGYCNVIFDGPSEVHRILGKGPSTVFRGVMISKQSREHGVVAERNVMMIGVPIQFTKGKWEQRSGILDQNVAQVVQDSGSFIFTGSGALRKPNYSVIVNGRFVVNTTGMLSIGTNIGNASITCGRGGKIEFQSGTVRVNGQLRVLAGSMTMTGGKVTLDPQGGLKKPLNPEFNVFEIGGSADFSMTGGSIQILNPLAQPGPGREISITTTGKCSITGGRLVVGDSVQSKSGGDGFEIFTAGNLSLNELEVFTSNGAKRDALLLSDLRIAGILFTHKGAEIERGQFKIAANKKQTID